MMEALNEFLGRTTVDPDMKLAFNQGRLEDALVDCGFTEAQAARLSEVEASDFTAFLRAFYTEVVQQVEAAEAPPHPWPSEGLARDRTEREAREEAA